MKRIVGLLVLGAVVVGGLWAPQAEAKKKKPVFLYVLNSQDPESEVHAYTMDKSGQLTALPGSPFSLEDGSNESGGQSGALAYAPSLKLLFAGGANGVTVFQVAKDGSLTRVVGSPFGAGNPIISLAPAKLKNKVFLYASSPDTDEVLAFSVAADGSLVSIPGMQQADGFRTQGVSTVGKTLYVVNAINPHVTHVTLNPDGSMQGGANTPVAVPGTLPFNVNADPTGPFVYFADYDNGGVFGFKFEKSTNLVALAGSPFSSGTDTDGGIAIGKGNLVYAFGFRGGANPDVQAYQQAKNGTLSPLGAAQDLGGMALVDNLQFDPSEKFLAAISSATNDLRIFAANKNTGALTQVEAEAPPLETATGALFVQP